MAFTELIRRTDPPPSYRKIETYIEGRSRPRAVSSAIRPTPGTLELPTRLPALALRALSDTLVTDGYIYADDPAVTDLTRDIARANRLSALQQLATHEALAQGAVYWVVGPGPEGPGRGLPRITLHSRAGVATAYDEYGQLSEAVITYTGEDKASHAAHYLPGHIDIYRRHRYSHDQWQIVGSQETEQTTPTIFPMFNRTRLDDVRGRSELVELMDIADAISRTQTGLQLLADQMAWSIRYILADDHSSIPPDVMSRLGDVLRGPAGSTVGQLQPTDPGPLLKVFESFVRAFCAQTGLPPTMAGISTDNPTSAEAMLVARDALHTRAEAKASSFSGALEDMMVCAVRMSGHDLEYPHRLEHAWRDSSRVSANARSAHLLQAQAQGVISAETAREHLRLTPEQLARERDLDDLRARQAAQLGGWS